MLMTCWFCCCLALAELEPPVLTPEALEACDTDEVEPGAGEEAAEWCSLLAAEMRRMGCEHALPSAHVESGQPHSSCLLSAACLACRCFSINWVTIASTVSAV